MNRTLILIGCFSSTLLVSAAYAQTPAYPPPVPPVPATPARPASPAIAPQSSAPLTAAAAATVEDVSNPKLRDELLAMRDEDQRIRRAWIANPKDEAIKAESKTIDDRNVARVTQILEQIGWPTVAMVGQKASAAAWLVIQHGPLSLQEKYLDLMKSAAKNKDLNWALVATTIDRVRIGEGKPQLYGTQWNTNDGHFEPLPIEDPAHLEDRRREAGMSTMADYEAGMRRAYGKPAKSEKAPIGPAPNVNPH